ncbi:Origin recognition complex subunit 4 [Fusarium oxysporum f. sp. albedinis]|nr:Origin recognition complex subunit 4 [Fusarium oxysporum f. sp. albedinis]
MIRVGTAFQWRCQFNNLLGDTSVVRGNLPEWGIDPVAMTFHMESASCPAMSFILGTNSLTTSSNACSFKH